jgi:hypothetical protein
MNRSVRTRGTSECCLSMCRRDCLLAMSQYCRCFERCRCCCHGDCWSLNWTRNGDGCHMGLEECNPQQQPEENE